MKSQVDSIAAVSTAPGFGGVGIIRVSGDKAKIVAQKLLGFIPQPRYATYTDFFELNGNIVDKGIALYFPSPHSYTGEDILELQGHGGPVILDILLKNILQLDIRHANPGEFSERAFLNDKLDLAQAEAVVDLIYASTEQAAKSAIKSLQGIFSDAIKLILVDLIYLRTYVEASLDFSDQEIDLIHDQVIQQKLIHLISSTQDITNKAKQGRLLTEGMTIVIAGKPNVGKSSLLNQLSQKNSAIVTNIAGTTRDVIRDVIQIDGMPIHIIDTAGLRESFDHVEKEGIKRAWQEIERCDHLLLVIDRDVNSEDDELLNKLPENIPLTIVRNKIDLSNCSPKLIHEFNNIIYLSAKTGLGIDLLRQHLMQSIGYTTTAEGTYSARTRHINALKKVNEYLMNGLQQLQSYSSIELMAEDLLQAQKYLSQITGEFSSDDLLGEIFSSFCIGK